MKRTILSVLLMAGIASASVAQSRDGLKVFISVDMEGITGLVLPSETSRSGDDYGYFRQIMTKETNAAIEGALAAGATDIVVRDSHGSARNILPEMLNRNARLLREWSGGPKSMMEGIDETFDAVLFVGYHAKAGTADAIIDHTMSGNVMNVEVNGVSLPEAGINALIAGHYDVPIAFVAGDQAICDQAAGLFGEVEAVAVVFLHSFRNPAHEKRAREILAAELPQASISVSSAVAPEIREFERMSTTVANA